MRESSASDFAIPTRDENWGRLKLLLSSSDVPEAQKRLWAERFVARFQDNLGVPAVAGADLAPYLKTGTERGALKVPAGQAPARASEPAAGASAAAADIEWVPITGGTFMMGSAETGAVPLHPVTVKTFRIARTPVTVRQYSACVAAGACKPVPEVCLSSDGAMPMVCVTLEDAQAFSRWVGGRLPSEAEWEYAARSGGQQRKFPWGDEPATCERAVMNQDYQNCGCARISSWPVCSKPRGNTDQGLCDMAGNVFEWVADEFHSDYVGAPADGAPWRAAIASGNVVRGGSWYAGAGAQAVMAAARDSRLASSRKPDVGFRPVKY